MSKILIVEDQKITQQGLIKMAKEVDRGLEIIATECAGEALDYARKYSFDAFFLDIQLVDYSGLELAKQIREMERYMFTPVIFITAIPTRELEAFRQIHCYDYIIKPFSERDVLEVFEKIIKNYIPQNKEEPVLRLERRGFVNRIKQKDIICLEFKDRKICITALREKIYYTGKALNQLSCELTDDFIQVHQAFIINKKYIRGINLQNNEINLEGIDRVIPIGRTYKKSIGEITI